MLLIMKGEVLLKSTRSPIQMAELAPGDENSIGKSRIDL
jgi:hypothetical protein